MGKKHDQSPKTRVNMLKLKCKDHINAWQDATESYLIIGQNKHLLGTYRDGNGGKVGQKGVKMAIFAIKYPWK